MLFTVGQVTNFWAITKLADEHRADLFFEANRRRPDQPLRHQPLGLAMLPDGHEADHEAGRSRSPATRLRLVEWWARHRRRAASRPQPDRSGQCLPQLRLVEHR